MNEYIAYQPTNQTYEVTLETITPVHIGTGEELVKNEDFIQDGSRLAIINENKLADILGDEVEAYLDFVNPNKKGDRNLLKFLRENIKSNFQTQDIASRYIDSSGLSNVPKLKQALIDAQGKHYIAGSSLKGAIRTAMLNDLIDKDSSTFVKKTENLKNYKGKFDDTKVISNYLGNSPEYDILRFLQVSDFYAEKPIQTVCSEAIVINLHGDEWREDKHLSNLLECIPAKTVFKGRISINTKALDNLELYLPKINPQKNGKEITQIEKILNTMKDLDISKLLDIINKAAKNILKKENEFWEEEDYDAVVDNYISETSNIYSNTSIIRIGASSGWDSITGRWIKKDGLLSDDEWKFFIDSLWGKKVYKDLYTFPKTRKMSSKGVPFGFVKLTVQ